ncbi:hypothetical protein [Motilimonas pumila]|uniref:Uncharacterized protein n=1 Tax=Motilimonas pumila TaxID=2303987 RepID=A0A418YFL0_9GAMM|nr:hypothetical protein [Motilimonas pumila]RJG47929.1 hypothetical protein D1Z90_09455 [Motilimonas pumila]
MSKNKKPVVFLFFFIALLLLSASIMGENARSEQTAKDFFNAISEMEFNHAQSYLTEQQQTQQGDFNSLFALEASLQEFYQVPVFAMYQLHTSQRSFWLPYISQDTIRIDGYLAAVDQKAKVKTPFTLELIRYHGNWKISAIDLPDNIQQQFQHYQTKVAQSQYMDVNSQGLTLQDNQIPFNELSLIERKILQFNLNSALEKLANASN